MGSTPKATNNESTVIGMYRCAECEEIFESVDDLREHRSRTGHQKESKSGQINQSDRSNAFEQSNRIHFARMKEEDEANARSR
jgi:hypothetical protein